jgi:hypothetical protein
MTRCRNCDHTADRHQLTFDGRFVTIECYHQLCACHRFTPIDDMAAI